MKRIGLVLASIFYGALILYLAREMLNALRTGKIRHTDTTSVYSRRRNPGKFWAMWLLFGFFVFIMGYMLVEAYL